MNDPTMNANERLRPSQVVMLSLVLATLAGGFLLLSAAESATLVDGARPWREDSPLRAVVQLLCLDYRFPTIHAGDVKSLILATGAGLAALVLGIALAVGSTGPQELGTETAQAAGQVDAAVFHGRSPWRADVMSPWGAAQWLAGLFLLWSLASARWSAAPNLANGATALVGMSLLWSVSIAYGLGRAGGRIAAGFLVIVTALTAAVAIWYFYGRNPLLRAKFPMGNPSFLATCLIPGVLVCAAQLAGRAAAWMQTLRAEARGVSPEAGRPPFGRLVVGTVAGVLVLALTLWAFSLTGSRGPAMGLGTGTLAVVFFALRGRAKLVPSSVAAILLAAAAIYFVGQSKDTAFASRAFTIRFRLYSWSYAWRMFLENPISGHGQGGFALRGDSFAVRDVLDDPPVFEARIAHAHNEWLETLADLGIVGLGLQLSTLLLSLWAGVLALRRGPPPAARWTLIGLQASLVGLVVAECFGVGMRVAEVPVAFYTVLGLLWAMSAPSSVTPLSRWCTTAGRRWVAGAIGCLLGLAVPAMAQQDFHAALQARSIDQLIEQGDFEQALASAERARGSLNPQRALVGMLRLAEAHMLIAGRLQQRAADREGRSQSLSGPAAEQLVALAAEDRARSDDHCKAGSGALKELIARAPGFFNHGRVEYLLYLIQAANAAARNDPQRRELLLNARTALERELDRQPFEPSLAADLVAVCSEASEPLDVRVQWQVLSRPLRYHALTPPYLAVVGQMAADPDFATRFEPIIEAARQDANRLLVASEPQPAGQPPAPADIEPFLPERLRLGASLYFRRGDYDQASDTLRLAEDVYNRLGLRHTLGAASASAELADSRFFQDPQRPDRAIEAAQRAIDLAPASLAGRKLQAGIQQRLVDYLLAANNEAEARTVLAETGLPNVSDEILNDELGLRYRRLCESLLRRRLAYLLRQSPNDLLPRLRSWSTRAIELRPEDPVAYYVAADLAFHAGDCAATEEHLRQALAAGMDAFEALRFLEVACEKRKDCAGLCELFESLDRLRQLQQDAGDATNAPAPSEPQEPGTLPP